MMCSACLKNNARKNCGRAQCGECCDDPACRVHNKKKRKRRGKPSSTSDAEPKHQGGWAEVIANAGYKRHAQRTAFHVKASELKPETMCFPICASGFAPASSAADAHPLQLHFTSQDNVQLILDSPFCTEQDIRSLWTQKERLSSVFDGGREGQYYYVRDSVFPNDHRGSRRYNIIHTLGS